MAISPVVKARYAEIRAAAELALIRASEMKNSIQFSADAINWGDLSVVCVEGYFDDMGDSGVRVYIEEAAPDSNGLCNFVSQELERVGFPDIEVRAEW